MLLTAQTFHFAAIRVTITGRMGCNTYQLTVQELFDVHTCNGPVMQAPIPIATGAATLHTSDGYCSNLTDRMNNLFL